MKYYVALTTTVMAHRAFTCEVEKKENKSLDNFQLVHVDLSREEAFDKFSALKEMVVFSSAETAIMNAEDFYHALKARHSHSRGFIVVEPDKRISSNKMLHKRYGEGMSVYMREETVAICYQLEMTDDMLEKNEKDVLCVKKESKDKVKLESASVANGVHVYLTDEYARQVKRPVETHLDHKKLERTYYPGIANGVPSGLSLKKK